MVRPQEANTSWERVDDSPYDQANTHPRDTHTARPESRHLLSRHDHKDEVIAQRDQEDHLPPLRRYERATMPARDHYYTVSLPLTGTPAERVHTTRAMRTVRSARGAAMRMSAQSIDTTMRRY